LSIDLECCSSLFILLLVVSLERTSSLDEERCSLYAIFGSLLPYNCCPFCFSLFFFYG
jgi:hypothetical protein